MKASIVVTSNCQTYGLAAAMMQLFPQHDIKAIDLRPGMQDPPLVEVLRTADAWFTADRADIVDRFDLTHVQVIKIPRILFSGFHPDSVCPVNQHTKKLTKMRYSSCIGVWAYNNKIDPVTASGLFNAEVFDHLGYYNLDHCIKYLQTQMESCDLDFRSLYLHVKRQGVFMHTMHHPKQFFLKRLAQVAAAKANIPINPAGAPLEITDGLANAAQWPIYPEIGEYYSLKSSYLWKFGDRYVDGLVPYLTFAFDQFEREGIRPGELTLSDSSLAARCEKTLPEFLS